MLKPILAAAILMTSPLALHAQDAGTVVATVNGEDITLGQLIVMRQSLGDDATANMPADALWDLMLDQMVRQTAVAQQAGDPLSAKDQAAIEIERRAYLAGSVLEKVASAEPTEEELRAAYDAAFPSDAAPATEYNAAHILVATKEEADAIKKQLDEGGDFAAIATEKSTDNSSMNGGDLGWFQAEQMVQPFADAVKALEKDQISEPVESQFGWHVIKMLDSREVTPPSIDEVREQLATQVRREKVQAEIEKQVADSDVQKTEGLDPALLGQVDLLEK